MGHHDPTKPNSHTAHDALTKLNDSQAMEPSLRHLALILDGNGRWATRRGQPRSLGHLAGAKAAGEIITACAEIGIPFLSLFVFSQDNWKRPKTEIRLIFEKLCSELTQNTPQFLQQNIKIQFLGDLSALDPKTQSVLERTAAITENQTGMTVIFAVNYSGRWDLRTAAERMLELGGTLESHLATAGIPSVDLLIRTGGETRISDFYLWQLAYSEIHFVPTLWPDFTKDHIHECLRRFRKIERRFGGLTSLEEI